MRIVGGTYRGRRLAALGKGDPGAHLRPTTDRVREALFNMLGGGRFGDPFGATRALDLFAGTGALGLEALSRGVGHVTFVDDGRVAGKLIRDNITALDCADQATLIKRDARRLPPAEAPCELIFLDPPYGQGAGDVALAAALAEGWIAPGALVVWEETKPQIAPRGFAPLDARRYGDTTITLLRAD